MAGSLEVRCFGCMTEVDAAAGAACSHCGYAEASAPEPTSELPRGTVLDDQYLVGRVLGEGGFGITYLGWDRTLETKVAIKEYFPDRISRRSADGLAVATGSTEPTRDQFEYGLERFQEEARKLYRFRDHHGIISVHRFFRANGTAYLIMEYLEGMTLEDYLHSQGDPGTLSWELSIRILMPVMDALRAAHASDLIHRDVSPDNIYLTGESQVKLLDFGAARYLLGKKTKSVTVLVKEGYAPPEQYMSKGEIGPWSDIFAVASTFYRMVCGEAPPTAPDRQGADEPLVMPSQRGVELPPAVEQTMERALSLRWQERFQDVGSFQEALRAGMPGASAGGTAPAPDPEPLPPLPERPEPAYIPPPAVRPERTERREQSRGPLVFGLIFAAVVATAVGLWASGVLTPGPPDYGPGYHVTGDVSAGERIRRGHLQMNAGGDFGSFEEIDGGCYEKSLSAGERLTWSDITSC